MKHFSEPEMRERIEALKPGQYFIVHGMNQRKLALAAARFIRASITTPSKEGCPGKYVVRLRD